jgi:hypothetical protein
MNTPDQQPQGAPAGDWKCPHCGSTTGHWFDRSFAILPDGTEEGMKERCSSCGKDIDEPPQSQGGDVMQKPMLQTAHTGPAKGPTPAPGQGAPAEVTPSEEDIAVVTSFYKQSTHSAIGNARRKELARLIAAHVARAVAAERARREEAEKAHDAELHVTLGEMLTDEMRTEFGISEDRPAGQCVIRALGGLRALLRTAERERDQMREALEMLYGETADYIRINNLGDVHHNRAMQLARFALALTEPTAAEEEN